MRLQMPLSMYPFTSQKCPFIPRIAVLVSRIALLFPEVPSFYLVCASFSKNDFFHLIVSPPHPAQSCPERYLPFSFF